MPNKHQSIFTFIPLGIEQCLNALSIFFLVLSLGYFTTFDDIGYLSYTVIFSVILISICQVLFAQNLILDRLKDKRKWVYFRGIIFFLVPIYGGIILLLILIGENKFFKFSFISLSFSFVLFEAFRRTILAASDVKKSLRGQILNWVVRIALLFVCYLFKLEYNFNMNSDVLAWIWAISYLASLASWYDVKTINFSRFTVLRILLFIRISTYQLFSLPVMWLWFFIPNIFLSFIGIKFVGIYVAIRSFTNFFNVFFEFFTNSIAPMLAKKFLSGDTTAFYREFLIAIGFLFLLWLAFIPVIFFMPVDEFWSDDVSVIGVVIIWLFNLVYMLSGFFLVWCKIVGHNKWYFEATCLSTFGAFVCVVFDLASNQYSFESILVFWVVGSFAGVIFSFSKMFVYVRCR